MPNVVKCINHIRSRGLKHRQFHAVLEETESAYEDVLYFTQVCWFSRWKVLKRFSELRAEVKAFMEKDGGTFPVLTDPKWLMDFLMGFSCWHHTEAECTEQEVTMPRPACQCCIRQCQSTLHKTYVMESPAFPDKPLPFPSMQGTQGGRLIIQKW